MRRLFKRRSAPLLSSEYLNEVISESHRLEHPASWPTELDIVSWNIEYGKHFDEILNALLSEPPADIYLLQEVDHMTNRTRPHLFGRPQNIRRRIAQALKMSFMWGIEYQELKQDAPDRAAFTGQQTLSRYILTHPFVHRFRHQPADWSRGMCALLQKRNGGRMFLYTTALVGAQRIHLYNTHLESRATDEERAGQMEEILSDVAERTEPEDPVLVVGDFNTELGEASPIIQALLREGFSDPFLGKPEREVTTNKKSNKRLDYIFSRNLEVIEARIAEDFDGSDHRRLWVRYRLEGKSDSRTI